LLLARILHAVRGSRSAILVGCAVVLCAAAVPALADPGASASGGASAATEIVVKRGDRGSAVRSIQSQLGIAADGVFGPMTERAVKRFQRRHDLVPDGIVGPLTRGALGLGPFSSRSIRRTRSRGVVQIPAILERIAECESGGNPRATSPRGTYRGKYQFSLSTWRTLGGTGDPADAPEWLQDRLALKLYRMHGTAPWPNCA
jgi:peptidoglycan hydrolase-like protein with peptidoglycan-binding domain